MTAPGAVVAFTGAAALLTVTPGLDTALVLRTAAVAGQRRAMSAAVGICLGCLAWGSAVSAGLGAVLVSHEAVYLLLRIAGGAFLVWTGATMLRRARRSFANLFEAGDGSAEADVPADEGARASFRRGLLTNLLNPKVGAFYVSFLPLFVPRSVRAGPFCLLLAGIHATEGLIWFAVLVLATGTVAAWLRRPRVRRALNAATGIVFVGCGIALVLDR